MPDVHAKIFSPSAMERLLKCFGSYEASKDIPEQGSLFADEGTEAHSVASYKVKTAVGITPDEDLSNLVWRNKEMEDATDGYLTYCLEKFSEAKELCKDASIMVETRVAAPSIDEDLFGTTDCAILAGSRLYIIDFKYGKGVQVDATNNFQEMTYAVCCLETFGDLYDFEEVVLCIYQPRLNSISEWTIKVSELKEWVETVLKPGVKAIREGSVEFHPGKHCQFCKAKPFCKALRDKNLELAKHEFRPAFLLDDDEIEEVLLKADEFINWINSVKDYALSEAIHGKRYKALKLVEGRSTRKFSSEADVARVVQEAGYDPFEHKLLSITDMTSLLGKTQFNELLSKFIVRTKPKLALVKRDDKRPEVTSAEADFKDIDD